MELKTFYENFEVMAEAPNGVEKLREMILQLAVEGKLVPQDPNDEPASALIEKIKPKRDRLISNGKFKKADDIGRVERKTLFAVPKNWCWCRLNDIAAIARGGSPRPIKSFLTDSPDGLNWIKIGDTDRKSRYIVSTKEKIKKEGLVKTRTVYPGDLILSNSMSYGFPYILKIEGCIHDGWLVIRTPEKLIDKMYLCHLFLSMHAKKSFESAAAGAVVQNLNADKVRMLTVPLPPLAEQKRIVAKVDELMALCDDLVARKQKTHQACIRLNDASIDKLLTAPTPAKFNRHWQRICDNFDLLYGKPENVSKLRQAILQLAVQGKLVKQDPKDEPASVLLEKIQAEQEQLPKAGKSKKQKPLPEIDLAETPFELPTGWVWARFPELGEFGRGKSKHRPRNAPELYSGGTIPLVQTGDVARSNGTIGTYTGQYNEKGIAQSRLWNKGTMCITIAANIADSGILGFDACFPDSVVGFVPSQEIGDARYFEYFIRTAKSNLMDFAPSTAQKNINLGILNNLLIPLPPASEIKRVVAKVDQLMALCDQLVANLIKGQAKSGKLLEAAVADLLAA